MWMYKATGDDQYLEEAKKWFDPEPDWGMSWDDKVVGCQVSLTDRSRLTVRWVVFVLCLYGLSVNSWDDSWPKVEHVCHLRRMPVASTGERAQV